MGSLIWGPKQIDRLMMSDDDFTEVYNFLAKGFQQPLFEEKILDYKIGIRDFLYPLSFVFYASFVIGFTFLFSDNLYRQMGLGFVSILGISFNVLFFLLFLFLIRHLKKPHKQGLVFALCYILGMMCLVVGFIGFCGIASYLNQLLDHSSPERRVTSLIKDKNQSDESENEDGICYKFRHFEEMDRGVGIGNLCQREYPGISESTQVEVYIKKGNFNEPWVFKYGLLEKSLSTHE